MANREQGQVVQPGVGAGEAAHVLKTCGDDGSRAARLVPANQVGYAIDSVFAIVSGGFREAIGVKKEQVAAAHSQPGGCERGFAEHSQREPG